MKKIPYIYGVLLLCHLAIIHWGDSQLLLYLSKPALASSLIIFYILEVISKKPQMYEWAFLTGLVFCFFGDILLMWNDYFLQGLITFLVAQCLFSYAYIRNTKGRQGYVMKHKWTIIPFVLYGLAMVYLLQPYAPDFMIPIIAYSAVLLLMAISALNRYKAVPKQSFLYVAFGAALFVISDSILAWDHFAAQLPFARGSIMLTYGLAIFLMTYGMIKFRTKV